MAEQKNEANLTPVEKLTKAVENIKNIFAKYKVGDFDREGLTKLVLDINKTGEEWYSAYETLSRFSDNDIMYDRGYHSVSDSVDSLDKSLTKLEINSVFVAIMAKAKQFVCELESYNPSYIKELLELSSQLSQCETEKENILQSYLDAGISSIIIEHFVKNQNPNYSDLLKKGKGLEIKIGILEKEQEKNREDIKTLKSSIEYIETQSKLKYIDPDPEYRLSDFDDHYYYRYNYNQAIQAEMQKLQASQTAQRKRK